MEFIAKKLNFFIVIITVFLVNIDINAQDFKLQKPMVYKGSTEVVNWFMSEKLDIQVNRNTVLIPNSSSSDSLPGEREFNRVKRLKKEWAISKTSKAIKENYGTDYTKFMNAIVTPC